VRALLLDLWVWVVVSTDRVAVLLYNLSVTSFLHCTKNYVGYVHVQLTLVYSAYIELSLRAV